MAHINYIICWILPGINLVYIFEIEAIKKRPANTVRTDRAMLRIRLYCDDVYYLTCDHSTAFLVA